MWISHTLKISLSTTYNAQHCPACLTAGQQDRRSRLMVYIAVTQYQFIQLAVLNDQGNIIIIKAIQLQALMDRLSIREIRIDRYRWSDG